MKNSFNQRLSNKIDLLKNIRPRVIACMGIGLLMLSGCSFGKQVDRKNDGPITIEISCKNNEKPLIQYSEETDSTQARCMSPKLTDRLNNFGRFTLNLGTSADSINCLQSSPQSFDVPDAIVYFNEQPGRTIAVDKPGFLPPAKYLGQNNLGATGELFVTGKPKIAVGNFTALGVDLEQPPSCTSKTQSASNVYDFNIVGKLSASQEIRKAA